ncbi:MAG: TVP38/TMEM64 family protein [Clostridia bacterium]|nr:TVP38/TMEM64 family protein [Clostridia bacterium]
MKRKILLACTLIVPTLALILFLWLSGGFKAMGSLEEFRAYVSGYGGWAHVVYWLAQFLAVVLAPIPGNVITLAGGVMFGTFTSILLSLTANYAASFLVFGLCRLLGKSFAQKFMGKHSTNKYYELFTRKRDSFLFLTILFPFFPDDIICMLAGLTTISFGRFACILVVAKPWGLIAASILGDVGLTLPLPWLIVLGVLAVAIFVLGLRYGDRVESFLRRKFRKVDGI